MQPHAANLEIAIKEDGSSSFSSEMCTTQAVIGHDSLLALCQESNPLGIPMPQASTSRETAARPEVAVGKGCGADLSHGEHQRNLVILAIFKRASDRIAPACTSLRFYFLGCIRLHKIVDFL